MVGLIAKRHDRKEACVLSALRSTGKLGVFRDNGDLMVWTAPERHLCARVMGVVTNTRKEPPDMQVTTIGLDLAKQIFKVHGIGVEGVAVLRRRLRGRRS